MSKLAAVARFAYEFVVGDDPLIAVVVMLGLGITAIVADAGASAWWVLPSTVVAALTLSLLRARAGGR